MGDCLMKLATDFYHKNLTQKEVYDIVQNYLDGATQASLASDYDVSIKEIYNILYCKIYKQYKVDKQHDDYFERLEKRSKRRGRSK